MTKKTLLTAITIFNLALFTITITTIKNYTATISRLEFEKKDYKQTIDILTDLVYPDPKKYPVPDFRGGYQDYISIRRANIAG